MFVSEMQDEIDPKAKKSCNEKKPMDVEDPASNIVQTHLLPIPE
jgi:hypothetical protein